ncbi:putative oxidoreductase [Lachnellula hyalina]|uniref:Putative oxidoreductase n=1 Tax=Lachnellula hyalina TaxID=1316788 RepID=A0A8H8R8Y5_9HELO|nr:putative oxidoreductase [Lachnellula hyalina]TVY30168.1 putative oxidoreductase [Lachnellula hyalina]
MAQSIVILGSGIIGVSTAYYLSQSSPASSIHLVEPSPELFASASGFAGGFLAADWFSPSVAALGKLSFEEHKRLAEEFGGREKWGYSRSTGLSYTARKGSRIGKRGDDWLRQASSRSDTAVVVSEFADGHTGLLGPEWLSRSAGDKIDSISEEGSTAQVWVRSVTDSTQELNTCLERGVQLHHPARAVSIDKDMRDELSSIRLVNTETNMVSDIPCSKILIAAGAWSTQVFSTLFPTSQTKIPISSLAGHSLVVRSPRWSKEHEEKGCHAIFTSDEDGYSPELFSRLGGEIYIAGLNDASLALPKFATDSKIEEGAVSKLKKAAQRLLGTTENLEEIEVVRKGLCFRPITKQGTPIMTNIHDENLGGLSTRGAGEGGVWLAAGHGPWGISLSLGTGKVMSEMILGKSTSVDVERLRP